MHLRSFAIFKLIISRHRRVARGPRKRGALGHGLCVNPSLLAAFIGTCTLGLAVGLVFFQLHVHSVILDFVRYQQNCRQVLNRRTLRLCKGSWQPKTWQNNQWFKVFHTSICAGSELFLVG